MQLNENERKNHLIQVLSASEQFFTVDTTIDVDSTIKVSKIHFYPLHVVLKLIMQMYRSRDTCIIHQKRIKLTKE